ncbi:MAG: RDD family protein [Candidatus Limnocylindrales bacterium]
MHQPPPGYYAQPPMTGPAPCIEWGSRLGRFIAYLVDGFVMALVIGVFYAIGGVVIAAGVSGESGALAMVGAVIMLAGIVVGVAWKPWWWTHGGQTPGYRMMGLRVVREQDGGPITTGQAIGRLLGYIISAFFYLGFIWILFDARRQGWHDKLAGTVVIGA